MIIPTQENQIEPVAAMAQLLFVPKLRHNFYTFSLLEIKNSPVNNRAVFFDYFLWYYGYM
jgi:hypothetical protein